MVIDPCAINTQAPIGPAGRNTRILWRKREPIWSLDNPSAALIQEPYPRFRLRSPDAVG
jgi:hypothetical protein